MTAYELIRLNERLLQAMSMAAVQVDDVRHIPMYEEYKRLTGDGIKRTYIMRYLSDEYTMSERQVYRIVERMSKAITV